MNTCQGQYFCLNHHIHSRILMCSVLQLQLGAIRQDSTTDSGPCGHSARTRLFPGWKCLEHRASNILICFFFPAKSSQPTGLLKSLTLCSLWSRLKTTTLRGCKGNREQADLRLPLKPYDSCADLLLICTWG